MLGIRRKFLYFSTSLFLSFSFAPPFKYNSNSTALFIKIYRNTLDKTFFFLSLFYCGNRITCKRQMDNNILPSRHLKCRSENSLFSECFNIYLYIIYIIKYLFTFIKDNYTNLKLI